MKITTQESQAEQARRLAVKTQDQRMVNEVVSGTGMSPWEAQVVVEVIREVYFATPGGATQLESLSLESIDLPDERVPKLQAFAHLKSLTLVRYGKGYPDDIQAKVKALLPKIDVKFVK